MIKYCAGFLFDNEKEHVVLIRKNRPDFMKGKLNAIGGKIEKSDGTTFMSQIREFEEEAGVRIESWENFCCLSHNSINNQWRVEFYKAFVDYSILEQCYSKTDEQVDIYNILDIMCGEHNVMINLPWLIQMALSGATFHEIEELY